MRRSVDLFSLEFVFSTSSFDDAWVAAVLLPLVTHFKNFDNYRSINLVRGEKRLFEALVGG